MPSYRVYPDNVPRRYAREKLSLLRPRADHSKPIGDISARFAVTLYPDIPVEAFHGFTAFTTSPKENTTEAVPSQSFHEVGLYQVEAGPRGGPAPNPIANAENNHWGLLHDRVEVVQLLGRNATMIHNAWKTALDDQIAVGLVNLRFHAEGLEHSLGHPFSTDPSSTWWLWCAFTAFSRGNSKAAGVIRRHWETLKEVAENLRWRKLRELVVNDIIDGHASSTGSVKSRHSYSLIRTEQKAESGYLLAQDTNGNAAWFASCYEDTSADNALEDRLARNAGPPT